MMHVQNLSDAEWAEAKVVPEDGEVCLEERRRPAELGEEQDDDLEDDEEAVEDRPERAGRLVGNGASRDVVERLVSHGGVHRALRELGMAALGYEVVDGLDVEDEGDNAAGKYEEERDDAEGTDDVETEEYICKSKSDLVSAQDMEHTHIHEG
jgi:hypothetical protein